MGLFDWLLPKKQKGVGSGADFSTGHDFSFTDSWNKQRTPEKYDLLSQYEDVVYTCANFNVSGVTSTPLRLYVKMGAGQSTRWHTSRLIKHHKDFLRDKFSLRGLDDIQEVTDPSHPLLKLLDKPNDDLDGCTFLELLQLFQEIIGTSYVHPIINRLGVPQELYLLPPQYMWARKDNINGRITHYEYICNGKTKRFEPSEIIKFTLPNLVDIHGEGMSPLRAIWEPLTIANKVLAHEAALLDNQARPGAIASVKDGLGEKEAARWEWKINNKFRRQGNGGVVVLEEDSTITPLGWNPKDLGMLQVLAMTKTQIANAYGVPLAFLDTSNVNRANMIASQELHVKNAIAKRLKKLERILNDNITRLFDPSGRLFLAFDNPNPRDKEFELEKMSSMATVANTLVSGQVWTPNEAREEFGLEPIDGGDSFRLMPGEMLLGSDEVEDTPDEPQEPTTDEPTPVETEQDLQTSPALTLNGAQIASAMNIVTQVAEGMLPRNSGIGALQVLLNLTQEQAEQIMGDVGRGFTPASDEGKGHHQQCGCDTCEKSESKAKKDPIKRSKKNEEELRRILRKHFEKWSKQAQQALKSHGQKAKLPSEFIPLDEWSEALAKDSQPVIELLYQDGGETLLGRVGASPDAFDVFNEHVKTKAEQAALELSEETLSTTTKEINDALDATRQAIAEGLEAGDSIAQLTRDIKDIFEGLDTYRARRISQTESAKAHSEGLRQAAVESGIVTSFTWLASSDPCPICQELNGKRIELDGELPPRHPLCECFATENVID